MLNLKRMALDGQEAHLHYSVSHNVGALPTLLEQDLFLTVDVPTGKVSGKLVLDELTADSLNEAREKLATWCDRMAAALRTPMVQANPSVPVFSRLPFDVDLLAPALQDQYHQLVRTLAALPAYADRQQYLRTLVVEKHPLIYVPGALDHAGVAAERAHEGADHAPH